MKRFGESPQKKKEAPSEKPAEKMNRRKFLAGAMAAVVAIPESKAAEQLWINPDHVYTEKSKAIIQESRNLYASFSEVGNEWFEVGSKATADRLAPYSQDPVVHAFRSIIEQGQDFQKQYGALLKAIGRGDNEAAANQLKTLQSAFLHFAAQAKRAKQIKGMSEFIKKLRKQDQGAS